MLLAPVGSTDDYHKGSPMLGDKLRNALYRTLSHG